MSLDLTDDEVSIGLSNDLLPERHQAITWASVDPGLCCYMASLGHNELKLNWSIKNEPQEDI